MATITREQVKKANDKMGNGFTLDIKHFVIWGEKQAEKYIDLPNGNKLLCTISYRDYSSWKNNFQTDLRIEIITSEWKPTTSGCWCCDSGHRYYEHSKGYSKKMFSKIQAITHEISDEMIYSIDCKKLENVASGF